MKHKNNTTTNNESKNLEGITDLGINKTKQVNDKDKKEIDKENMDIPVKETNNIENNNELEVQDKESQDIKGPKETDVQRDDIKSKDLKGHSKFHIQSVEKFGKQLHKIVQRGRTR